MNTTRHTSREREYFFLCLFGYRYAKIKKTEQQKENLSMYELNKENTHPIKFVVESFFLNLN